MDMSRIDLQNKEFDAVKGLAEQYRRITMTAVVDDDYPEVRHGYETAMSTLLAAVVANGRMKSFNEEYFKEGNSEARRKDREAGAEGIAQADVPPWRKEKGEAQDYAESVNYEATKAWQDAERAIGEANERAAPTARFVAQDWTSYIPMMQQTVLFGIVRGPDGVPKYHPCKSILRWYRRCLLLSALDGEVIDNPWDPRGGSFTGPSMPMPSDTGMGDNPPWWVPMQEEMSRFMQTMDQMPIHFWLHMMHAVEIMGVHHSDPDIRSWWTYVYERMAHAMHLYPENEHQLNRRLGDTREGWLERSDPAITK